MKKMERWKKITLLTITIIIATRIGYIIFRGEVEKEYYTSASYDLTGATTTSCQGVVQTFTSPQDRLNSLELIFDNVADNEEGAVIVGIYSGDELIYQTNITLSTVENRVWKKLHINAKIFSYKEYKIVFSVTETCTQIPDLLIVNNSWAPEILASYSNDQQTDGQIAVQYGYLREPGMADRLVISSLWIWLWLAIFLSLYYFDCILQILRSGKELLFQQVNHQIFITVFEIILCMIILNSSGIEFQGPTKIILYVISLIVSAHYTKKTAYVNALIDCTWKKALIILLYLYAAFALVGHRIWIYPLTLKLTMAGLSVFLCTILWFIPVIQNILYYFDQICGNGISTVRNWKTWQFIVFSVLVLLIPAAYNLFANNPGISTSDTYSAMITNARHLHGMYDWHPAFYCMVLRGIQEVWNSTYAVIIVQYFFWAYVVTELMLYLREKGIRESILVTATLFMGLNTGNYLQINTIWKDIPYTLSLFWTLVIVAKLSVDFEKYQHKWYIYLELVIALVGVCMYRKNGMVPFIIIIISLALILRKNIKLLVTLAISIILIYVIKGPVYQHFEIEDPGYYGMYIGLSQDILGVYYAGGEISEDTLQMINVMTDYNNAEYYYNPTWSNQSYYLDVEIKEFILNYINTLINNPVTMARAIIAREDALWDIYVGENAVLRCINVTGTMDGYEDWNDYYTERKYVSLYPVASAVSLYSATSQWISAIAWRCGLFSLLSLVAVVFLILKIGVGKYLLIITPAIGHIIGLLLSTGWSDFRYFWPVNLINMSVLLLMIVIAKDCFKKY